MTTGSKWSTVERTTAAMAAALYLLVLVSTFIHLSSHPHVYSPRLNAFIHPKPDDWTDHSSQPVGPVDSHRTRPDRSDHRLTFYIGYEAEPAAETSCLLESAPHSAIQPECGELPRAVLDLAPKHSPPSA